MRIWIIALLLLSITGISAADESVCLKCHEIEMHTYTHAPYIEGRCEICHNQCLECEEPHEGLTRGLILNLTSCVRCHTLTNYLDNQSHPILIKTPNGLITCVTCHNPHGSEYEVLHPEPQGVLCRKCHSGH